MSAPNVACELMMGWWGVGFSGEARRPAMHMMQSSPFVQCMVKVSRAPAVCGVPTGSCQGMCVGARPMEAGRDWNRVERSPGDDKEKKNKTGGGVDWGEYECG